MTHLTHLASEIRNHNNPWYFELFRQNSSITVCGFVKFSFLHQNNLTNFSCLFSKAILRQRDFVDNAEPIPTGNNRVAFGHRNQIAHGNPGSQGHFQSSNSFNQKAFHIFRRLLNCLDCLAETVLGCVGTQARSWRQRFRTKHGSDLLARQFMIIHQGQQFRVLSSA